MTSFTRSGAQSIARRLACVLLVALPFSAHAQAPNEHWRTISTEHFRINFPRELEALARRAGGEAERAWTRLVKELDPPRGPVDIVLSDNQDQSNGQATYYPTNRIVIWAHPPVDDPSLRFGDDWLQQVVTHELTHVFHLDRSRGLWRAAQFVFGRHPSLFPNARAPRWLTEGIAVSYESRLGSGGRLNGSELYATLDATTASGRPLTPGRLSLATPYWPAGNLAYFAGAWLVSEAQRAGGDSSMRRFINRVAVFPIPYLWDLHAKMAFGGSFGSIARNASSARPAVAAEGAPALTPAYWDAHSPRWRGDSIYFTASGPKELTGLFVVHGNDVHRVARRNSTDAFSLTGNRVVYGQLDFTDPYRLYSGLYVDGDRIRGTERFSSPDARADGAIVAVETAGGTARLVMLGVDGKNKRGITPANPDVQWSAPRWSRRGDRIAAMRWVRGGQMDVVVMDTTGRVLASYARARAVQSHPSWDIDDRAIYFTSDRAGRSAVYRVRVDDGAGNAEEVMRDAYGLFDAEVSTNGAQIAAFRVTPEGVALIVAPVAGQAGVTATASTFAPGTGDTIVTAKSAVHNYHALLSLIPRYWVPTLGTSTRDNVLAGFHTSGIDVVGRYQFAADGSWDVETGEFYGDGALSYRGFGRPVVDIGFAQGWSMFNVANSEQVKVGDVSRRNRTASASLTWSRPRVRNAFSFTAGAEMEWRDFRTHPESLALHLEPPLPANTLRYPTILAGAGWSNATSSPLGIGPEDGISFGITARRRWRTSDPDGTLAHSGLATLRLFKSMPLGGYARHSVALRGAFGLAEPKITSLFSAGGVSGTSLEVLPGYRIGDVQRSFFVRGFPPGVQQGTHAWSATAEYRAPLMRIARGLWPLPFFWERAAVAVFGDAANAWCPARTLATALCPAGGTSQRALASVGAELLFDTTLDYDSPTRFRLGVAAPVHGQTFARGKDFTVYFSLGLPF